MSLDDLLGRSSQADGADAKMRVLIPDDLMRALPNAMIRAFSRGPELPPPAPEKQKQEQ